RDRNVTGVQTCALPLCPAGGGTLGRMSTPTAPEATLLVVEDETNIRELLTTSLKFAGFAVHAAPDGNTALRLAGEHEFDLAVMRSEERRVGNEGRVEGE